MDDVKIYRPDECRCYELTADRTSRAMYELPQSYAVQIVPGKRAFLLVEMGDAREATHYSHNGLLSAFEGRHWFDEHGINYKPWYKLIPLTPPEPTPEEIAEKAKESAWKKFLGALDGCGVDYRKVFEAGYDAHAALAAAKK